MTDENIVGNDTAPAGEQESQTTQNSLQQQVNPGAIRKSTTQNILNALSNASGENFDSVESAIAYITRSTEKQNTVDNAQSVEQPTRSNKPAHEETDLREQFVKLQRDLQQKENALRQKELDSEILNNMGDRFDPDLKEYALQKVKNNLSIKRDGTYTIINSKGQERYSSDGNPLSLQELVNEVAQGNPKLLKQSSAPGGSGLRPGQQNFAGAASDQIPDYSRDPAAFNAWAKSMGLGKGSGLKGSTVQASVSTQSRKVI